MCERDDFGNDQCFVCASSAELLFIFFSGWVGRPCACPVKLEKLERRAATCVCPLLLSSPPEQAVSLVCLAAAVELLCEPLALIFQYQLLIDVRGTCVCHRVIKVQPAGNRLAS